MNDLSALSDDELLRGIESQLGSERQLLARLLRYLIEVEERRLDLRSAGAGLPNWRVESDFSAPYRQIGLQHSDSSRRRRGDRRLLSQFSDLFATI